MPAANRVKVYAPLTGPAVAVEGGAVIEPGDSRTVDANKDSHNQRLIDDGLLLTVETSSKETK